MNTKLPIGSIVLYPYLNNSTGLQEIESQGWMFCDGRSLQASAYPGLFNVITYTFGGHEDYFALPDYRTLAIKSPNQPNAPLAYYMIKYS